VKADDPWTPRFSLYAQAVLMRSVKMKNNLIRTDLQKKGVILHAEYSHSDSFGDKILMIIRMIVIIKINRFIEFFMQNTRILN
jgi:hypothetical protein